MIARMRMKRLSLPEGVEGSPEDKGKENDCYHSARTYEKLLGFFLIFLLPADGHLSRSKALPKFSSSNPDLHYHSEISPLLDKLPYLSLLFREELQ